MNYAILEKLLTTITVDDIMYIEIRYNGTLYGAINSLLDKEWIRAIPGEKNSRKKEYIITESGKSVVCTEINRLKELLKNGKIIMEEK